MAKLYGLDVETQWEQILELHVLDLAKRYHSEWYKWRLSNNYERAVFLKEDAVLPRETTRYLWARQNMTGNTVLEIGCSTGFGSQFIKDSISYLGLDYDPIIIDVAKQQNWGSNRHFFYGDINNFPLTFQDTIIAFEVIEHLYNGLEIVKMLKTYCNTLLISVPYNEPIGFWGEHHKLHNLTEKDFEGFTFEYIDEYGNLTSEINPQADFSLMVCKWTNG